MLDLVTRICFIIIRVYESTNLKVTYVALIILLLEYAILEDTNP